MRNLTKGRESRVIFTFALPMLIGNVLQQVYNLTDAWVVGQFVGKTALAAVGSSFSIVFLLVALVMGVTMGSGIMISQFYGAGDMERVRRTISTAYWYVLVASVVLTGLGLLVSRPLLVLLRVPDEVLPQAVTYLNIMFTGTVLSFQDATPLSAVLRALGDSRTPLYSFAIAVAANVGLDLLFVIVFGWGVAGAAWATIISQGIAFVASFVYMQRSRHAVLHIDVRNMVFDRAIFARSMRIGLPGGRPADPRGGRLHGARLDRQRVRHRCHGRLHRRAPEFLRGHARDEFRHGAHDVRGPEPGAGKRRVRQGVPRHAPDERGIRAGGHPADGVRQGAAVG